MEMQKGMTKTVKKYGNSGGVYLPSSWIGGNVEVRLINKPPDPEKDILLAFSGIMRHIVSILIYGSYAKGEQSAESDIDIIVVTDTHIKAGIPDRLKSMRYDIRIMTIDEIRKAAERDALFRKSLEDSRAILNDSFIDSLRSVKINKKTLRERIEFAESSLGIIRGIYETCGRSPELIYPLIMRIKEMLLIKCILENKKYSFKLLENSIREENISKSDFMRLIEYYRATRDNKKPPEYSFNEQVFSKLIKLLGGMIADARKKEKA